MRRALPLVLVLLAGCADAMPPARSSGYEFAITLADGFPLIFRWTPASLPVRVWAEPVGELRVQAGDAIRLWQSNALYGEFVGVLVADSSRADVIVLVGEPQRVESDGSVAGRDGCFGRTLIEVELDTTITLPFRTVLHPRLGASGEQVQRCFALVMAHELGHALGLFRHSDDPNDLMSANPNPLGLSARDQATFATLYHTTPTVRVPDNR